MSTLSSLKLVAARKPSKPSGLVQRRHKLSNKLWEQLQLAKGKSAVEVAGPQELIKTLEAIKAAVEAGELDAAIDTASQSLREGFAK